MTERQDRRSLFEAYSSIHENCGEPPVMAIASMEPEVPAQAPEQPVEQDPSEIHMAQAELKKAAEYAMKLSELIETLPSLEGWTASKITKASDYLSSVYHWLDYEASGGQEPQGMFNVGAEDTE